MCFGRNLKDKLEFIKPRSQGGSLGWRSPVCKGMGTQEGMSLQGRNNILIISVFWVPDPLPGREWQVTDTRRMNGM